MSNSTLHAISEATNRLAAHNARINDFADQLTVWLDPLVAAAAEGNWANVGGHNKRVARQGTHPGSYEVSAKAGPGS